MESIVTTGPRFALVHATHISCGNILRMEILTKATRLNIQSESMVDDRPEIQLSGERKKNSVTGLLSIIVVIAW